MSATRRPWVILGCGYAGERLATRLLARGTDVIATVRREDAARALAARLGSVSAAGHGRGHLATRAVDVSDPLAFHAWLPLDAVVVDSVPPETHAPSAPPHTAALVTAVAACGGGRVVYLSTTGVYPRGDGGWVDESTPVAPDGPRGASRLEAERALTAAADATSAVEVVSLRIAAIYGPGRGVADRLRAGTYMVPGDGATWISRVHVDDLVSTIIAVGDATRLRRRTYCVADDDPCQSRVLADAVARALGVAAPASVPFAAMSPLAQELAGSNRRVNGRALRDELGIAMRYPSWRDGVAADLGLRDRIR